MSLPIPILADTSLPLLDRLFDNRFIVTRYKSREDLFNQMNAHRVLLCRSTLSVDNALLAQLPNLEVVATASSGRDHIVTPPSITVLDAKGSNAHAVADYVLCVLAHLAKQRAFFPQTAGIIGVGAVGHIVSQRLKALGMTIRQYDPLRADIPSAPLIDIARCDLICVHANLHDDLPHPSRGLLNADFFHHIRPGSALIQASRGGVIHEADLLAVKPDIYYCADVFQHEPSPSPTIIEMAEIATPHIAGHAIEAKLGAMVQLQKQLYHYFDNEAPVVSLSGTYEMPLSREAWQAQVLEYYNPLHDTVVLKHAPNLKETFLARRTAHQHRHHFSFSCFF